MIHTGSSRNFWTTIGANHPALNLVKWRTPGYLTSPRNGEHRDTIVHKTTKLIIPMTGVGRTVVHVRDIQ